MTTIVDLKEGSPPTSPPEWESARPKSIFLSRGRILTLFLIIDCLIYLDRGIVPGAHDEYEIFLQSAPAVREHPEFFFGMLQSVFIGGLAIAAPVLSWLAARTQRPLLYLAQGLVVWTISLTLCAAAGILGSVPLFFVARALSGVGEGAFIALMIPILVDAFSVRERGLFLGLFYGLMPVGTAAGFVLSATLARYFPCWLIFVFLASIAILPIWAVCKFSTTPASHGLSPLRHFAQESEPLSRHQANTLDARSVQSAPRSVQNSARQELPSTTASDESEPPAESPQITPHFRKIIVSPHFLSLTLAGAAQAALSAVLVSFGVAFLLNLGLFPTELRASMVIGIAGSALGAIGTVVGGLLLWIPQKCALRKEKKYLRQAALHADAEVGIADTVEWEEETDLVCKQRFNMLSNVTKFILCLSLPSAILLTISPVILWLEKTYVAAAVFGSGLILIFMCQSGLNLSVMLCAPASHRSLAISAFALGLHLFGDVPGPVLIGYLKDILAPNCSSSAGSVYDPSEVILPRPGVSSECLAQRSGVLMTLGLSLVWSHFVWIGVAICTRISKTF